MVSRPVVVEGPPYVPVVTAPTDAGIGQETFGGGCITSWRWQLPGSASSQSFVMTRWCMGSLTKRFKQPNWSKLWQPAEWGPEVRQRLPGACPGYGAFSETPLHGQWQGAVPLPSGQAVLPGGRSPRGNGQEPARCKGGGGPQEGLDGWQPGRRDDQSWKGVLEVLERKTHCLISICPPMYVAAIVLTACHFKKMVLLESVLCWTDMNHTFLAGVLVKKDTHDCANDLAG